MPTNDELDLHHLHTIREIRRLLAEDRKLMLKMHSASRAVSRLTRERLVLDAQIETLKRDLFKGSEEENHGNEETIQTEDES